jgi:hypothetical protein
MSWPSILRRQARLPKSTNDPLDDDGAILEEVQDVREECPDPGGAGRRASRCGRDE